MSENSVSSLKIDLNVLIIVFLFNIVVFNLVCKLDLNVYKKNVYIAQKTGLHFRVKYNVVTTVLLATFEGNSVTLRVEF